MAQPSRMKVLLKCNIVNLRVKSEGDCNSDIFKKTGFQMTQKQFWFLGDFPMECQLVGRLWKYTFLYR